MSLLIKAGAGLCAGIVAGTLGYAFWPRIEPAVVSARPAVEKPVFVVASAPPRTAPSVLAATLAQPVAAPAGDKASSDKLEAASHLNPGARALADADDDAGRGRRRTRKRRNIARTG